MSNEFIKSNPYPTFEEMKIKLTRRFDLDAEYGRGNHNQCKTIYDNLNDDKIIIEMVQKIGRAGGITALHANLDTLKMAHPHPFIQLMINNPMATNEYLQIK